MRKLTSLLVTGGAGFIGSALVRQLLQDPAVEHLTVLDNLTASERRQNLVGPDQDSRLHLLEGDICDRDFVEKILDQHQVTGIFHLAAEFKESAENSPDDESTAIALLQTNVLGTSVLLDLAKKFNIPLLHCSTDEVYGPVGTLEKSTEESPLSPTTAYAASKASADLLCLTHHRAHDTDVLITRCTNNYGPRLPSDQLISRLILGALRDEPLTLARNGMTIRDWIHVDDHCAALLTVYKKAKPGHVFNFGGHCERTDIGLARSILKTLGKPESLIPAAKTQHLGSLGTGPDDHRYAIDTTKAQTYFGWEPQKTFHSTFPDLVREICAQNQSLL